MKGIKSRLARDTTKFAVVPLLLALAVVLIVMNIKHSMECLGSGEGADEAALKRQALEKRLLAHVFGCSSSPDGHPALVRELASAAEPARRAPCLHRRERRRPAFAVPSSC